MNCGYGLEYSVKHWIICVPTVRNLTSISLFCVPMHGFCLKTKKLDKIYFANTQIRKA